MTGHLYEERKSCVPGPCTKCGPDQKCQENTCVFDPCSQCTDKEDCLNDVCVAKKKDVPIAAIIGGIGGAILLIAIGVGVFFYMRKKKKDQAAKENAKMEEPPVFYKD